MLMRAGRRAGHAGREDSGRRPPGSADGSQWTRGRRRDRRERGIRGPLAPKAVPVARSRSARFDEQVLVAWDRLVAGHPELRFIEIAVSDVPEPEHPALAVYDPADAGLSARVTVFRWALELRAGTPGVLHRLLQDVLTEQAGRFLAIPPEELDGGYPRV